MAKCAGHVEGRHLATWGWVGGWLDQVKLRLTGVWAKLGNTEFDALDHSCLTHLGLTGPRVVKISHKGSLELACSFLFTEDEFWQVDLKWDKDTDEEPFLQLVPSYGGQPQVVGEVDYVVGHRSNTTMGHMKE